LTKRIAVGLRDIGLVEGDTVGLLSVNEIHYYVLGDGVIAAGATFCPLPTTPLDQAGKNNGFFHTPLHQSGVVSSIFSNSLSRIHRIGNISSSTPERN